MKRVLVRIIDTFICLPLIVIIGLFVKKSVLKIQPKKILCIKLAAMGDSILMLPIIKALRAKFPQAQIDIMATKINIDVFRMTDYFDNIIELELIKGFLKVRKERYDIAVDFEQRFRFTPLLSFIAGIPVRIGFNTPGYFRHFSFTQAPYHDNAKHEFQCYKDLIKDLVEVRDGDISLKVSKTRSQPAEQFIAIHPGCGNTKFNIGAQARQWPKEKYAELIHILNEQINEKILLTAGEKEAKLVKEIQSLSGNIAEVFISSDLESTAMVLSNAKLIISSDTGIAHLAAALKIPQIVLFGPSEPQRWKPLNEKCIYITRQPPLTPCQVFGINKPKCKKFECIREIEVRQVFEAVLKILNEEKNIFKNINAFSA